MSDSATQTRYRNASLAVVVGFGWGLAFGLEVARELLRAVPPVEFEAAEW